MLLITLAFIGTSTFAEEKIETNVEVDPKNYIPKQTFSDTEKLACGILVLGFILEFISMVLIDEVGPIPPGPFTLFGILTVILLMALAITSFIVIIILIIS